MRRLVKLTVILSAFMLVIVGVGLLALASGRLNPYLRAYLQQRLAADLGVEVNIGGLQGNPLTGFRMERVRLGSEPEPLLTVAAVEARYRATSVLSGMIIVDRFDLFAPMLRLPKGAAGADSTVRLAPDSDPHWWRSGPALPIHVRRAEVVDGRIMATAGGRADSLDMVLGLRAGPAGYELALRRLRSLVFDPPLVIRDLSGVALLADGGLTLDGVRLRTPGSRVQVDGTVTGFSRPEYDLVLRADSLSLDEISRLLPGTYPPGSLAVGGRVWGDPSRVNLDLKLDYGSTACAISGFFDHSGRDVFYEFAASATEMDLGKVVPGLDLDARFDGDIQLTGKGIDRLTADVSVRAGIARAHLYGTEVDTANLAATLRNGKLRMEVRAEGDAGGLTAGLNVERNGGNPSYELRTSFVRLDLSRLSPRFSGISDLTGEIWLKRSGDGLWRGEAGIDVLRIEGMPPARGIALRGTFLNGIVSLDSIGVRLSGGYGVVRGHGRIDLGQPWNAPGRQPAYRAGLRVDGLAAGRLLGRADLLEDVSLQIGLAGVGFHPDSVQASADVILEASRFLGGALDSGRVGVVQQGRRTVVNRAFLSGPRARVEGSGWFAAGDSLDILGNGQLIDLSALDGVVGPGVSGTPVSFVARIHGTWSEHVAVADLRADSVNTGGFPIHGVEIGFSGQSLSQADLVVHADSLIWGTRAVNDLTADLGLDAEGVSFILGSRPDEIDQLDLRGRVRWADAAYVLDLDSLAVGVGGVSLASHGASRLTYGSEDGLSVEHFSLVGDGGVIHANGHSGKKDGVVVSLSDVDLKIWSGLLGMAGELSGMFTGKIALSGRLDDPRVKSELALRDAFVAGVGLKEVSGTLGYRSKRATVDLKLVQSSGREAATKGHFPLDLTSGGWRDLFPRGPVEVSLKSGGIDLNFLPGILSAVQDAEGSLEIDLTVTGTPQQLLQHGWLRLRDASAMVVPLNTTFEKVAADLNFDGNRIVLERFETGREKKRVALKGELTLNRLDVERYDLSLKADEFEAIDLSSVKATLSADLHLKGTPEAGRMRGRVALSRAVLRLSDFIEYPTDVGWMSTPLYQNLNCDVRVSASRNVWIRDRELNVEIAGDVDLVKDGGGIRIYGSLDSRQGRYEFQNTSFAIDRGEINFLGGSNINPDLYIIATRRIRLVSNENAVISVVVGGTLLEPDISLESDTTPPMDEADILSYLLLGRPADDVSGLVSGEGGAGSRLEGQAAGLVLGVAANQLKRAIGRRLNLDVVEIDLGMGNTATRVRAGKYFGSRFFVSYAQDVSEARGREVVVEYELLPQVTLEAQQREGSERERDRSSLGIFWKKEW